MATDWDVHNIQVDIRKKLCCPDVLEECIIILWKKKIITEELLACLVGQDLFIELYA